MPFPPRPQPPAPVPPSYGLASAEHTAAQIVHGGTRFSLDTPVTLTGTDVAFDAAFGRFEIRRAGVYRIEYAFDYLAPSAGAFAVELQNFSATRDVMTVPADRLSGRVDRTVEEALPAGALLYLYLVPYPEAGTIDVLQITDLTVTVRRIG